MRDGGARKGESSVHAPPEAGMFGSHGSVHVARCWFPGAHKADRQDRGRTTEAVGYYSSLNRYYGSA